MAFQTLRTVGLVLALIGGIVWLILGILIAAGGGILGAIGGEALIAGVGTLAVGIVWIIFSILIILGAIWIKKPESCMKGSIVTLIFGILSVNLLAIVGAILGFVAGNKP